MSQIGDLAVRVGADTADFESGMAKAARSVRSFSESAAKQLRSVATSAAKVGAAATVAGAAITAALYSKQSKVIDSLAKTAEALNVTTESLQAMNHLAELNGISSESMAKGLRRMEVNLGMAARQGGAAAKALADVGVDIKDVLDLKPDEQLQALAGAISNVENQSIKASIATDLFGRDGVGMLKVLNQVQKDGIAPTVKMLEEYGIAISGVDAAQVEAANDSFLEAQKIIEGVANTLTVELAPFVKEIADRFKLAAKESGGFGDEVENAVRKAMHFAAQFADVLHGLRVVFKGVELVAVGFGATIVSVFELALHAITAFADNGIGTINSVITAMNKLPKVSIGLVDSISDSDFMVGIHKMGDDARNQVSAVRMELSNLAMQQMPSGAVEEFLEAVKAKSIETAEVVAAARDQMINPSNDDENETPEEKYARQEQALREHLLRMHGIQAEASNGIKGLIDKQWGSATSTTVGAMKSVVGTMSQGSKTAFEISKKWAIADALISTFQGIAAGVKLGWPMAIPAVAWAAATGFAQLSKIKSTSFGGGGGGGASSSAPTSSAPSSSGSSGGSGGASSSSTLTVAPIDPNAIFSGSAVQGLAEKLYDYTQDGGKVVFSQ